MAIKLPQTRLVSGTALRGAAERRMSRPGGGGAETQIGSALREIFTPPLIKDEPLGSEKTIAIRPENSTGFAPQAGGEVVPQPATPTVPQAGGLPSAAEASSIIREAIAGVTSPPSALAQSVAPSPQTQNRERESSGSRNDDNREVEQVEERVEQPAPRTMTPVNRAPQVAPRPEPRMQGPQMRGAFPGDYRTPVRSSRYRSGGIIASVLNSIKSLFGKNIPRLSSSKGNSYA